MSGISRNRAMVSSLRYAIESWWSAKLLKTSWKEYSSRGLKHRFANLMAWERLAVRWMLEG